MGLGPTVTLVVLAALALLAAAGYLIDNTAEADAGRDDLATGLGPDGPGAAAPRRGAGQA